MKKIIFLLPIMCLIFFTTRCKKESSKKEPIAKVYKSKDPTPQNYRLRKYTHVKKLYKRLASPITKLCIENRVPPGAILSILSLESGWGEGYIGQITGNFLSLNAVGNNPELPALFLPSLNDSKKILFHPKEIAKIDTAKITWKLRASSLKKDYRPAPYAGTSTNLSFLVDHPNEMTKANLKNVTDFVKKFISSTSRIAAYREARAFLDMEIEKNGIEILFDPELNTKFIHLIGGKPNSFNFRETWPKKAISIMKGVGAVTLSEQLYKNTDFETAWKQ
ncbi:hypothetical protein ACFLRU_00975 [Bacteroidota bacterium]